MIVVEVVVPSSDCAATVPVMEISRATATTISSVLLDIDSIFPIMFFIFY